MTSGDTITRKTQNKNQRKKGLTKLISLNSVRPFCWFHTYYLTTTGLLINYTNISCVIILLSNRTSCARKRPVYKGFQIFFIIQTPRRMALYAAYDACIDTHNSNLCLFFVVSVPLKEK